MILYFGDPAGALALAARRVPLCGLVLGRADAPRHEELLRRLDGLPRWTRPRLGDPAVQSALCALKPRLLVSGFYPRKIPAPILALAAGLNVHPSDLPRWRGPDPIYWTIRSGDRTTALCVHRLVEDLDAGEIYAREPFEVGADETAGKLAERLEVRGAELVAEVAERWLAGDVPTGTPQSGASTWAPFVRGDQLVLDGSLTPAEHAAHRAVLAAAPWPGARVRLGEGEAFVEVVKGSPLQDLVAWGPAGAVRYRGGLLEVCCGGGVYGVEACRRDGKLFVKARLGLLLS